MSKGPRFPISQIMPVAMKIKAEFEGLHHRCEIVGSLRRMPDHPNADIGDIDLVVLKDDEAYQDAAFLILPGANRFENKVVGEVESIRVEVLFASPNEWGACLLHSTGSVAFNSLCRHVARTKGMLLSQYGLFDRKTRQLICGATELEVLETLHSSLKEYEDPTKRNLFHISPETYRMVARSPA